MNDEQKKTQKKIDCLYDVVVKQYVPGSKVIAEETVSIIGKYVRRNAVLKNAINGKVTLDDALYNYEHNMIKYKTDFTELIGSALDKKYTSFQQEISNNFYTVIGASIGAAIGAGMEPGSGALTSAYAGLGAGMGYSVGMLINSLTMYLSERKPNKRVKLLNEVIAVYNEKKSGVKK
jgi:hypothetical protein